MTNALILEKLSVSVDGRQVVHAVDCAIPMGEIHALMGPNGSGKSTLAYAIAGHPRYAITEGKLLFDTEDITALSPTDRAKRGVFLSLQNPPTLQGVSIANFLRTAHAAVTGTKTPVLDFRGTLGKALGELKMDAAFGLRSVNDGFSGGEKKRAEMLQLAILKPSYAILDEPDSGLDIDALRVVAGTIDRLRSIMGILLITHYTRIFRYCTPDRVHIMRGGRILRSGGPQLAHEIDDKGYEKITETDAA
ncbi:MAG: Fe-S cluster assembly ATPase SufC [Parcubacteria group bacterium]|nr:Fe-S cluster assembly ATPase SufC [Parcubacteria group bacterium]